jgi:hypothetical protein
VGGNWVNFVQSHIFQQQIDTHDDDDDDLLTFSLNC